MFEVDDKMVKALFGNSTFTTELEAFISSSSNPNINITSDHFQRTSMNDLVIQINEHFLSYIDGELQKGSLGLENKFMMKNELIMAKTLNQIKQLKSELEDSIESIAKEAFLGVPKRQASLSKIENKSFSEKKKILKENRKVLTESILEYSRIEGNEKFVDEENEEDFSNLDISSNKTNMKSLNKKLKEVQMEFTKLAQEGTKRHIELNERIEETYCKMVKMRGELSQQMEASLGGIWNVISNLEEKLYQQQKTKRH